MTYQERVMCEVMVMSKIVQMIDYGVLGIVLEQDKC